MSLSLRSRTLIAQYHEPDGSFFAFLATPTSRRPGQGKAFSGINKESILLLHDTPILHLGLVTSAPPKLSHQAPAIHYFVGDSGDAHFLTLPSLVLLLTLTLFIGLTLLLGLALFLGLNILLPGQPFHLSLSLPPLLLLKPIRNPILLHHCRYTGQISKLFGRFPNLFKDQISRSTDGNKTIA